MKDDKIAEHWANRDDSAMGEQLGWNATPICLAQMFLARCQAQQKAND